MWICSNKMLYLNTKTWYVFVYHNIILFLELECKYRKYFLIIGNTKVVMPYEPQLERRLVNSIKLVIQLTILLSKFAL